LALANFYEIDMEEAMRLKEEFIKQKNAKRKLAQEQQRNEDSSGMDGETNE